MGKITINQVLSTPFHLFSGWNMSTLIKSPIRYWVHFSIYLVDETWVHWFPGLWMKHQNHQSGIEYTFPFILWMKHEYTDKITNQVLSTPFHLFSGWNMSTLMKSPIKYGVHLSIYLVDETWVTDEITNQVLSTLFQYLLSGWNMSTWVKSSIRYWVHLSMYLVDETWVHW